MITELKTNAMMTLVRMTRQAVREVTSAGVVAAMVEISTARVK
jgi:hypothetical protein